MMATLLLAVPVKSFALYLRKRGVDHVIRLIVHFVGILILPFYLWFVPQLLTALHIPTCW